jgi:hypothetical protein
MITYEEVKELFDYKDGELYWKKPLNSTVRKRQYYASGDKAGKQHSAGYIQITYQSKLYLAHRLIFLWHHGHLPRVLDHIDGDKHNNKIENLRAATHSENQFNRKMNSNNKSGYKGVTWNNECKKWQAVVSYQKKHFYLGMYKDIEDAAEAVKLKREELHKEFARHE